MVIHEYGAFQYNSFQHIVNDSVTHLETSRIKFTAQKWNENRNILLEIKFIVYFSVNI